MQLNAQAINVTLSTLSAEVQDEAIINGQPPLESSHLIWTRLIELYEKSKCDDAHELESMETLFVVSSCSKEASQDLKSIEPEQEVQTVYDLLSAYTYRMCLVLLRQQGSQLTSAMMIKLGGGQVMNHVQYIKILITCVSWPRKARRKPLGTILTISPARTSSSS